MAAAANHCPPGPAPAAADSLTLPSSPGASAASLSRSRSPLAVRRRCAVVCRAQRGGPASTRSRFDTQAWEASFTASDSDGYRHFASGIARCRHGSYFLCDGSVELSSGAVLDVSDNPIRPDAESRIPLTDGTLLLSYGVVQLAATRFQLLNGTTITCPLASKGSLEAALNYYIRRLKVLRCQHPEGGPFRQQLAQLNLQMAQVHRLEVTGPADRAEEPPPPPEKAGPSGAEPPPASRCPNGVSAGSAPRAPNPPAPARPPTPPTPPAAAPAPPQRSPTPPPQPHSPPAAPRGILRVTPSPPLSRPLSLANLRWADHCSPGTGSAAPSDAGGLANGFVRDGTLATEGLSSPGSMLLEDFATAVGPSLYDLDELLLLPRPDHPDAQWEEQFGRRVADSGQSSPAPSLPRGGSVVRPRTAPDVRTDVPEDKPRSGVPPAPAPSIDPPAPEGGGGGAGGRSPRPAPLLNPSFISELRYAPFLVTALVSFLLGAKVQKFLGAALQAPPTVGPSCPAAGLEASPAPAPAAPPPPPPPEPSIAVTAAAAAAAATAPPKAVAGHLLWWVAGVACAAAGATSALAAVVARQQQEAVAADRRLEEEEAAAAEDDEDDGG